MLHRESKLFILLLFICFLFLVSCKRQVKYDAKEIQAIRERCVETSQIIVGKSEYWDIYNKMNDSIQTWIENHLDYYKYYDEEREWLLDSVYCINSKGDKLIAGVLKRSLYANSSGDFIDYFYGVQINNSWFFFRGPGLVLPREYYQKDIHTPLSFEKLKQIATSNIYRGYLKKNRQEEWEINDDFFRDLTSVAWCTDCAIQEDWDSAYMRVVGNNWQKKQ